MQNFFFILIIFMRWSSICLNILQCHFKQKMLCCLCRIFSPRSCGKIMLFRLSYIFVSWFGIFQLHTLSFNIFALSLSSSLLTVYPSLDDDGDGPLFKSRSKTPRRDQLDLPWNPKAKVLTPSQKLIRPVRENARRPNIETGLADAAARLANKVPSVISFLNSKKMC